MIQLTQRQPSAKPDFTAITEAYIYLLGRILVILQEQVDLAETDGNYNVIKYDRPTSRFAQLRAWIAVDDRTPAFLEVPRIQGRYYSVQLFDEWGHVIANINERTFPAQPFGRFALVAPGCKARFDDAVARIPLHSNKARLEVDLQVKGDPETAQALQKQFALTTRKQPDIVRSSLAARLESRDLLGVEVFDDVEATLSSAVDVSQDAAEMQNKVRAIAAWVAGDPTARAAVDAHVRGQTDRLPGHGAHPVASRNESGEAIYFAATRDAAINH